MLIKLIFNDDISAGLQTQYAGSFEYSMIGGRIIRHHRGADCLGGNCCIHNPSVHPLGSAPLNWRSDRGIMERICEHGVGHPDPDGLVAHWASGGSDSGVHGCDGCCTGGQF